VQVMEASGIVADLLMTMHSSVLHFIGKGNSAPPLLMVVFSRLWLSFAVRTQEKWFGKCTCHNKHQRLALALQVSRSKANNATT